MSDSRFAAQMSVHNLKLRSVACVPLEIDGKIAGALYLDNRFRPNAFDDDVLDYLTAFADQAAIAMRHASSSAREKGEKSETAQRGGGPSSPAG